MAACGDVDELGAWLGVVRAMSRPAPHDALLKTVQADLIRMGSRLADPRPSAPPYRSDVRVRSFERTINRLHARLPALRSFVIPGDTGPSALLHVARAVCRRAERSVVALTRVGRPEPGCLVYLNRLSDLLFTLARAGATARRASRAMRRVGKRP